MKVGYIDELQITLLDCSLGIYEFYKSLPVHSHSLSLSLFLKNTLYLNISVGLGNHLLGHSISIWKVCATVYFGE